MTKKKKVEPEFDDVTGEITNAELIATSVSVPDTELHIIRTQWNRIHGENDFEKTIGVSKTVPGQALSVVEILERYASGKPLSGGKEPVYYGEEFEMPDIARLDLSEIEDLKEKNAAYIMSLKNKLEEGRKAHNKIKKEQELKEYHERKLKEAEEKNKEVNNETKK